VSAREVVHGREYRLARREAGGYWVRRADTGRTLGWIVRGANRWRWETTPTAYRGDGRPGRERDGNAVDRVPAWLAGAGTGLRRRDACEFLVEHLTGTQAPVMGYGPHSAVEEASRYEEVSEASGR